MLPGCYVQNTKWYRKVIKILKHAARWLYIQLVFRVWGLIIRPVSWVKKYTLNNYLDSIYQLEKMTGIILVNGYYKQESMMNWDHEVSRREELSILYSMKKGIFHVHGNFWKILICTYEKLSVFNLEEFWNIKIKMLVNCFLFSTTGFYFKPFPVKYCYHMGSCDSASLQSSRVVKVKVWELIKTSSFQHKRWSLWKWTWYFIQRRSTSLKSCAEYEHIKRKDYKTLLIETWGLLKTF